MSEDFKTYIIFVFVIIIGAILLFSIRTILPFVQDDEYYMVKTVLNGDKNLTYKVVHSQQCKQYRGTKAWFKFKYSLWDFVLEEDTNICTHCFSPEEAEKMLMVHKYNLRTIEEHYMRVYPSLEKVDSEINRYNRKPDIREVYYLE